MRNWITLVLLQLVVFQLTAQEIPVLQLEQNKIVPEKVTTEITTIGNMATTKHLVTFKNTLKGDLKGNINFSLKDNQQLVNVQLSVNGTLKNAHVVEKQQSVRVTNGVVRQGTLPLVVKQPSYNQFSVTIPSIKPEATQVIAIIINEHLNNEGTHFSKALSYNHYPKIKDLSLKVNVLEQKEVPVISGISKAKGVFQAKHNGYELMINEANSIEKEIAIKIPLEKHAKTIQNGTYGIFQKQLSETKRTRKAPSEVTIFWDASYSMKDRDHKKDYELLQSYFSFAKNITVHLTTFSNAIVQENTFQITNGDWSALKETLQKTVYDGATSYTNVLTKANGQEVLLFTDGMRTFSEINSMITAPHYIFINNGMSNYKELKTLAESTKGKLIDVRNNAEAIMLLTKESLQFLGYKAAENVSVQPLRSNDEEISIAINGITTASDIILQFGYGNEITTTEKVVFSKNAENFNIKNRWAQAQLKHIKDEQEYIAFAKEYEVLTDKTVFKVLNSPWDYISYQIAPPATLQKSYQQTLAETRGKIIVQAEENINTDALPKTIQGIVADEDGNPMIGATVRVKYSNKAVVTNDDGEYSIEATKGDILTFDSLGYPVEEVRVGKSNTINPIMIFDAEADNNNSGGTTLDTIIITAGNIKKADRALGYGVDTIEGEELAQKPEADVTRLLTAKSSGVQVTQSSGLSGSGTNIIIRGYTSITGSNQALFVVDGVPYSNDYNGNGGAFQALNGSSRTLDLDPNNIAAVTVLKGLAATTLYGSEGRNGVVLITTKTGTFDNKNSEQADALVYMHDVNLKLIDLNPNAPYIKALKEVKETAAQYELYLTQRESYKEDPAYFIDVYEWFKTSDKEIALRVLSNMAEVQFSNTKQLKALAFKLEETHEYLPAAFIYKQLAALQPNDVQVQRNLALAYQSVGSYKAATDILEAINKKMYDAEQATPSVTTILEKEYNNGKRLANAPEHQYVKMYNDLRIIAEWNTAAEIDLRVIDPKREECSFENEKTVLGGEIVSNTAAIGIEEFTLKNAIKGDYYVHVDYNANNTKTPTFLKVTTFKNYGSTKEQREVTVIKLDDNYKEGMLAKVSF